MKAFFKWFLIVFLGLLVAASVVGYDALKDPLKYVSVPKIGELVFPILEKELGLQIKDPGTDFLSLKYERFLEYSVWLHFKAPTQVRLNGSESIPFKGEIQIETLETGVRVQIWLFPLKLTFNKIYPTTISIPRVNLVSVDIPETPTDPNEKESDLMVFAPEVSPISINIKNVHFGITKTAVFNIPDFFLRLDEKFFSLKTTVKGLLPDVKKSEIELKADGKVDAEITPLQIKGLKTAFTATLKGFKLGGFPSAISAEAQGSGEVVFPVGKNPLTWKVKSKLQADFVQNQSIRLLVETLDGSGSSNDETPIDGHLKAKIDFSPVAIIKNKSFPRKRHLENEFSLWNRAEKAALFSGEKRMLLEATASLLKERLVFDVSAELQRFKEVALAASAVGEMDLETGKFPRLDGKADLRVLRFQELAESISQELPAPFTKMNGTFFLNAKIGTDENEALNIPFETTLALADKTQHFKLMATGNVGEHSLQAKVDLQKIILRLPPLDPVEGIPVFSRDSRIKDDQTAKASAKVEADGTDSAADKSLPFSYNIEIGTPGDPILLLDSRVDPGVSFFLNLNLNEKNGGRMKVRANPFNINVYARDAKLEKFEMDWELAKAFPKFEGRVRIPKTDYKIFANLYGSDGKTSVVFESVPDLPEEDIISLILFNALTAELDDESQEQSVGETKSAVANRALGFFSFWALASTPVESIRYDSGTGLMSARVKIQDGLSAIVGSDWDNTQMVGLRKRLGNQWAVSTYMRWEEGQREVTQTLLEWLKRF